MKTTGTPAPSGRRRSVSRVVGPSMPGIMTSSRTRSGEKPANRDSASSPEPQASTAKPPSDSRAMVAMLWMSGSSSTKRMRFKAGGAMAAMSYQRSPRRASGVCCSIGGGPLPAVPSRPIEGQVVHGAEQVLDTPELHLQGRFDGAAAKPGGAHQGAMAVDERQLLCGRGGAHGKLSLVVKLRPC